jgi:hypothetical protein
LAADANKEESWLTAGLGLLLGLVGIVGGVVFAGYARWLLYHDVELCEHGFRYRQGKATEEVPWSAVTSVRETILYERPPILKGPAKLLLPKLASRSYTVITKSGKKYSFDGNSIKRIKRFGALLHERVDQVGVPWETVEEHA